jgi:hypothetical protein
MSISARLMDVRSAPISGARADIAALRVCADSVVKIILSILSRNIDSRSGANAQQRFKGARAQIRSLQISISRSLLGDFCNTICQKHTSGCLAIACACLSKATRPTDAHKRLIRVRNCKFIHSPGLVLWSARVSVVPASIPLPYARNERLYAWVVRPALAGVVAHCRKAIQPWDMWIFPHIGD